MKKNVLYIHNAVDNYLFQHFQIYLLFKHKRLKKSYRKKHELSLYWKNCM